MKTEANFLISIHWFQLWVLKKIFKIIVKQSYYHQNNITRVYELLEQAAANEFSEDNPQTLRSFLDGCYKESNI